MVALQHARGANQFAPVAQQFVISLFWIYVAYSGWNAATYVAEEIRQPEKTLPRALAVGTSLVAALYLALNMVFLYAAPLEQMKGVLAIGSLAAQKLFGPEIAGVFSLLMAVSIMSTVSAMVTVGPRVYYAMARNRAFFAVAAKVHPTYRTPAVAIVAQGVCSILMTVTPFPQLLFYIGMTLNFTMMLAVASIFVFRKRQPGWQKLPVGELRMAAGAERVCAGRRVDDNLRDHVAEQSVAFRAGNGGAGSAGVSLPHTPQRGTGCRDRMSLAGFCRARSMRDRRWRWLGTCWARNCGTAEPRA